jgi:dolichyl-phosphate beta-glucosyltransferase
MKKVDLEKIYDCTSGNDLVLILPVFNEVSRNSNHFWEDLMSKTNIDLLFVDDASTDNSLDQLKLYSDNANVGLMRLSRNSGKAEAIRQAFLSEAKQSIKHRYIGYLDSDGAFPSNEIVNHIPKAIEKLNNGFSIYSVSRVLLSGRNIDRRTHRHIIGRMIRTLVGLRHKSLPYDTQSGFKLFWNDAIQGDVMATPFKTKWFVDIEIMIRRKALSNNESYLWEEPAQTWTDIDNSSVNLRSSFQILSDLIQILRMEK